jgi:hypothetical protein
MLIGGQIIQRFPNSAIYQYSSPQAAGDLLFSPAVEGKLYFLRFPSASTSTATAGHS